MRLKIAVYNVEWMKKLFDSNGNPLTTGEAKIRSNQLANVIQGIKPDFLGIVEGPDTKKDESKTASKQLENWLSEFMPNTNFKAVHGFISKGQQELCALFDKTKINVTFKPETKEKHNPFDKSFLVDTTDSLIKEHYQHFRPPLELSVTGSTGNDEIAKIIIAHTKSKGIFKKVDMARFEQISERDRKKLYAECMSIRERCNQWLGKDNVKNVIVMGDINDGMGMDIYENRFKKSAVEILLGTVWNPALILKSVIQKPKPDQNGWNPWSSNFVDKITGDRFNVLIDHILVSQSINIHKSEVWNPRLKKASQAIKDLKDDLNNASDHYPVAAEIEL